MNPTGVIVSTENHASAVEEKIPEGAEGTPLKVLIVGESQSLEHGAEILGTLRGMGYRITLIGPVSLTSKDLSINSL